MTYREIGKKHRNLSCCFEETGVSLVIVGVATRQPNRIQERLK